MDVFVRTRILPQWGQAVQADRLVINPGGKGFNQAVAARRLGAKVSVVSAVGNDDFGDRMLTRLDDLGISFEGVRVESDRTTPVCVVFSKPGGETSFVGWKNADEIRVDADLVQQQAKIIRKADVLLTTLEIAPEGVRAALQIADQGDCLKVLNPAPPLDGGYGPADLPLKAIDVLIPNEWEARQLAGKVGLPDRSIRDVANFLNEVLGVKMVCITRAHEGCSVLRNRSYRDYPAYETEADDTTGASDAFCAALALHMRAGYEFDDAIHYAQAAGSFAVRKQGAGQHMPTKQELDSHWTYLERLK